MLMLMKAIRDFQKNSSPEKKHLEKGQAPEVIFVTCADSRIDPLTFAYSQLGRFFVVRNAGNIIAPSPSGEGASIEYALKKFPIKEIIVCGHVHCGAMEALITPPDAEEFPEVSAWLSHAAPALESLRRKYPGLTDKSLTIERVTEENILLQIENLKTRPLVREKLTQGVRIHGWFYNFVTGKVRMHSQNRGKFISFEDAITELFASEHILKKMHAIVEAEAIRYLAPKTSPKTLEEYHHLMHMFQELKTKGVGIIWDTIKESTIAKLWAEFGGLCERDGGIDPRFTALVKRCLDVKLDLKCFQKEVGESLGYAKFCSQMMRKPAAPLVRTPLLDALENGRALTI